MGSREFFHAVQVAIDESGLRYQVHDPTGKVRERLGWPFELPSVEQWQPVDNENAASLLGSLDWTREVVAFRIRGTRARGIESDETPFRGIERIALVLDSSSRWLRIASGCAAAQRSASRSSRVFGVH